MQSTQLQQDIDQKLEFVERFDYGALCYIINNFQNFEFRPDINTKETLSMIQRYKAAANQDGTKTVKYRRATHGHGSYFAERGLSLQSMAREIRNTISYPFYVDIDFHNCHPNLLCQRCEKDEIPCPMLQDYCRGRDIIKATGKAAVLAVINGGSADMDTLESVEPHHGQNWLVNFAAEMMAVRERLVGNSQSEYLKLARGKANRTLSGNVLGSAMNLMLCDLENNALMALREFVQVQSPKRHVGVLSFDGCMVERKEPSYVVEDSSSELDPSELLLASDFVFERTGYRLSIQVKDMTLEKLDVPLIVYGGFSGMTRSPRFAEDDVGAGRLLLDDLGVGSSNPMIRSFNAKIWVRNNHVWTCDKDLVHKILLARCMGSNIMRLTEGGDMSIMSGNIPSGKRVVEAACTLVPDEPDLREKMWRSNIGVICYRNGIYDFRAGRFFSYEDRPDVMPVQVIQRDFPVTRPPQNIIDEVRRRILESTLESPDVQKTYLSLLARATAGEITDKQWMILLGERNSGKGLCQDLNQLAFDCYVNTVNGNAFLLQQHTNADAAKALSWALDCEYARQTYTNEIKCDVSSSRNIRLDGNILKSFQSGGDVMSARKNYMDERSFRVSTKLIMNLNDIPEVTPRDAVSTLVLIKFPFKFVSANEMNDSPLPYFRLRDDTIKSDYIRRESTIDAFTWLVIDAYAHHPVIPCESIQEDTMSYREDIGDDTMIMKRCFQVTRTREDIVLVKDIKRMATEHNLSITVFKERLIKMGAIFDKNCCVYGVSHGRGFMYLKVVGEIEEQQQVEGVHWLEVTSSASELALKAAIKTKTHFKFVSARPWWLANPETGHLMELDMYDEGNSVAIEYDGPQHYEFPNSCHKTEAEFRNQKQRDKDKTIMCRMRGVILIRVRASTLEREMKYVEEEIVKLGLVSLLR